MDIIRERQMKNYTYYNIDKINLQINASRWLRKLGLKETRWILDAVWLINQNQKFSEWINHP